MKPLFSVIIPIYQVAPYLRKTIDSVLNQKFESYEIILIDDGSSDGSSEIAFEYRQQHSHITLLSMPNQGVSVARNRGMMLARGDYVMFLDGDDYWHGEQVLSNLAKLIEQNKGVDVILFPLLMKSLQTDKETPQRFTISAITQQQSFPADFHTLVQSGAWIGSACTKIMRRSLLQQHAIQFPVGRRYEDFAFCFDLATHLQTYLVYEQPFYHYVTQRPQSSTVNKNHHLYDYIELLKQKIDVIQQFHDENNVLTIGALAFWEENFSFAIQFFNYAPAEIKALVFNQISYCIDTVQKIKTHRRIPQISINHHR